MHLYKYNYEPHSEELVKYEMKSIFGCAEMDDDYITTDITVNPNRSYFLNYRIDCLVKADTIDNLLFAIKGLNLYYEGFKIEFINVKSAVLDYKQRLNYCIAIADLIDGFGIMKNPNNTFVVTRYNNEWHFGELIRNDRSFARLQSKIHTYSHSMSSELSRTIVNIACGQSNPRLVDPCFGVGTVIAEAIDLGYQIAGTEYNQLVFDKACENLAHLGLDANIRCLDMHLITEYYDVSILDIPYGVMCATTDQLQLGLINGCYAISDKLLLVTNDGCDQLIAATKWQVKDKITIPKANYSFERYLYVLEKS